MFPFVIFLSTPTERQIQLKTTKLVDIKNQPLTSRTGSNHVTIVQVQMKIFWLHFTNVPTKQQQIVLRSTPRNKTNFLVQYLKRLTMFKVLKVYLKNSLDLNGQEIYCMRLQLNEGLDVLRKKVLMRSFECFFWNNLTFYRIIYFRSPQIKSPDAHIYWTGKSKFEILNISVKITASHVWHLRGPSQKTSSS